MKLDRKTIALILSILLNLLGGTGVIDPLFGGPAPAPATPSK